MRYPLVLLFTFLVACTHAQDRSASAPRDHGVGQAWPEDYAELDAALRKHSAKYKAMSDVVRQRQPYEIVSTDEFALGNVKQGDKGQLVIELNPRIERDRRPTILIWEMANAYQLPTFAEVTRRARAGEITSALEYGLRMEIVEYGSHRLHREVLEDLSRAGFDVDGDYLFFVNPKLTALAEYRVPTVHNYLDAQKKGGHTKHYETWYYRVTGKTPPGR